MAAKQQQLFFHVSVVVDQVTLHGLMQHVDGRSYDLKVSAVTSGGDTHTEITPETPPPAGSMRDFIIGYAARHDTFATADVRAAAVSAGKQPKNVYGALHHLMKERLLKRTAPGMYILREKVAAKAAAKKTAKKAKTKKATTASGGGLAAAADILNILQKGGDKPVPLGTIRKKMEAKGYGKNSVSPTLTLLLQQHRVTRPEPAHYLIAKTAPAGNGAAAPAGGN